MLTTNHIFQHLFKPKTVQVLFLNLTFLHFSFTVASELCIFRERHICLFTLFYDVSSLLFQQLMCYTASYVQRRRNVSESGTALTSLPLPFPPFPHPSPPLP